MRYTVGHLQHGNRILSTCFWQSVIYYHTYLIISCTTWLVNLVSSYQNKSKLHEMWCVGCYTVKQLHLLLWLVMEILKKRTAGKLCFCSLQSFCYDPLEPQKCIIYLTINIYSTDATWTQLVIKSRFKTTHLYGALSSPSPVVMFSQKEVVLDLLL